MFIMKIDKFCVSKLIKLRETDKMSLRTPDKAKFLQNPNPRLKLSAPEAVTHSVDSNLTEPTFFKQKTLKT